MYSGYFYEDLITFGDNYHHNDSILTTFGCHRLETELFYTQKADGILGLGPISDK